MARIDKEIWIKAPLDKIYDYISYPENMLEFWPSLMEVKDIQPLPNGGYTANWIYKMLGIRFKGKAEYTKIVPNEYFVIETKGGIKSSIIWTFRSRDDKTRVTFTVDYKIPVPLLGKLAEVIITRMNDQEGELIMANIHTRFTVIY